MECLLGELFGGGIADWQMIGDTQYDWEVLTIWHSRFFLKQYFIWQQMNL